MEKIVKIISMELRISGAQAKRHLRKFNATPKAHFELYLKECEWRFNTVGAKHQLITLKQMVKEKL